MAKIEAELSMLRETVFASVSAADLEAGLRVFQTLLKLTEHADEAKTIQAATHR